MIGVGQQRSFLGIKHDKAIFELNFGIRDITPALKQVPTLEKTGKNEFRTRNRRNQALAVELKVSENGTFITGDFDRGGLAHIGDVLFGSPKPCDLLKLLLK
jgi:hypothetical protein